MNEPVARRLANTIRDTFFKAHLQNVVFMRREVDEGVALKTKVELSLSCLALTSAAVRSYALEEDIDETLGLLQTKVLDDIVSLRGKDDSEFRNGCETIYAEYASLAPGRNLDELKRLLTDKLRVRIGTTGGFPISDVEPFWRMLLKTTRAAFPPPPAERLESVKRVFFVTVGPGNGKSLPLA